MASIKLWLSVALLLCSQQLFAQARLEPVADWDTDRLRDHPLVGRIYDSANTQMITPAELGERLLEARYLLLGEKHDNPDHHHLQRQVLQFLAAREAVAGVTFEMMDETVRERLIDLYLQPPMAAEELRSYLLWDEEGWDWALYGPLLESVYEAGLPIAAGNISRSRVTEIYGSVDEGEQILEDEALARLTQSIDESHCGLLPESQFPAMVRVQQARDRAMARALRNPPEGQLSVLVAGNFHAREDLGVANYLLRREPSMAETAIVSLAFTEVSAESDDAGDYLDGEPGAAEFDYLWFTPAVEAQDYCDSLR